MRTFLNLRKKTRHVVFAVQEVSKNLDALTGLTSVVETSMDGISSNWRFVEFPRPFGFQIEFKYELGVARATLGLDKLAAPLISSINVFTSQNWPVIESLLAALDKNKISIQVLNQGKKVSSSDHVFDGALQIDGRAVSDELEESATELLSTIVSIFGFMAGEEDNQEFLEFREEGAAKQVWARKYERSRFNRNLAIQIHGLTCLGCGFNFEKFYGIVGDGIVEIHHLEPVHLMEAVRVVDPRTELVPLCSNCHTLVHKIDPPYTLRELQHFVENKPS